MPEERLESWHSSAYARAWADEDVLSDILALPRRLSVALVADAGIDVEHVVDLGSGPGDYLDVFLATFREARGTWVDSSEPMEGLARERLERFGDRVAYLQADAERFESVELEPAQVAVTSRLLHHFSPESLRRFYAAVFELVTPGGFFFNLDHFGTPEGWEARYRAIREQFTGPRKRALKRHRHDYPFRQVGDHLSWIGASGFEPPDVAWRTFYTALIAARKPA